MSDFWNSLAEYTRFFKEQAETLDVGQWARVVIDRQFLVEASIESLAALDLAWEKLLQQPGIIGQVTNEVYGRRWEFRREPYNKVVIDPTVMEA